MSQFEKGGFAQLWTVEAPGDKVRIEYVGDDQFYGVYGYGSDGRFFRCPVLKIEVRHCEDCRRSAHPSGLCEEHRRLVQ